MGTRITIEVSAPEEVLARSFAWFHEVESCCSRFDPASELMRLAPGDAKPATPMLFEAVRFALMVAEESGGAFDPTVGHRMAARGFNREHRTGTVADSPDADDDVSYHDVDLDAAMHTIRLRRPLTLDLGAVAKGLAVDAAARELQPFGDFAIDAGGDLYLGGCNPHGEPWAIGIRHPRMDGELIARLRVSNQAVCTSGDYERGRHILNPRAGGVAGSVASATVVASGAMLADALATAAFVMGPDEGVSFLTRMGVEGLIVTPELECFETRGLRHA